MSWCPNCKTEYRDGFQKCSDCGAFLVDEKPQKESKSEYVFFDSLIDPQLVISSSDIAELSLIEDLLTNHGIRYLIKEKDPGFYINKPMMGISRFGKDVFVDREDYDAVCELLDCRFAETEEDFQPLEEQDSPFLDRKKILSILLQMIYIVPLLFFLISKIISYFKFK